MSREHPEIVDALVALCREMNVRCVVQVGAEDGWEADAIAAATKARAVAIDPDPQCFPCTSRIEFHQAVIGATDGDTIMYMHRAMGLSSLLPRGDKESETPVKVYQKRLDTFCAAAGVVPDALIIDTEGTTLDVLKGCGDLIDGVRLIYAEAQTREIRPGVSLLPDVDAWLTARGFVQREGSPAYCGSADAQGNFCWVRP